MGLVAEDLAKGQMLRVTRDRWLWRENPDANIDSDAKFETKTEQK